MTGEPFPRGTFLDRLSSAARTEVLRAGRPRTYEAGESLLRQGECTDHVLVLLSGLVKITAVSPSGSETFLAIRRGGDLLGELSAVDQGRREATCTAFATVTCREISATRFHSLLDLYSEINGALVAGLAEQMRVATRRRAELAGAPVKTRVARLIAEFATSFGVPTDLGIAIDVPLTQTDLAAAVGASEIGVHKALQELRDKGVVSVGYRRLVVLDPAALKGLSD